MCPCLNLHFSFHPSTTCSTRHPKRVTSRENSKVAPSCVSPTANHSTSRRYPGSDSAPHRALSRPITPTCAPRAPSAFLLPVSPKPRGPPPHQFATAPQAASPLCYPKPARPSSHTAVLAGLPAAALRVLLAGAASCATLTSPSPSPPSSLLPWAWASLSCSLAPPPLQALRSRRRRRPG